MPKNLLNYTFWAALELNNDTHPSGKKIQLFNQIFFHFTHLDKEHNQAWIYFHCLYAFIADKPPMFFDVLHVPRHVFLPLPVKVTLKCSKLPP